MDRPKKNIAMLYNGITEAVNGFSSFKKRVRDGLCISLLSKDSTMKKLILEKLLPLALFLALVPALRAQNGISHVETDSKPKLFETNYQYNNIPKINVMAMAFNNVSLFYERAVYPRVTASLGFGLKSGGRSQKLFEANDYNLTASLGSIDGYSITPEFRYYLKTCEENLPAGFYAGLYFRYNVYKASANFTHQLPDSIPSYFTSDASLRELGVGIQLGYQLVISKRFTVDFLFFGPRYSFLKLTNEFNGEISPTTKTDVEDYVNSVIERFGGKGDFEMEATTNQKFSGSMGFPSFRFGISLGYAF